MLVQNVSLSPGRRTRGPPQLGHFFGKCHGRDRLVARREHGPHHLGDDVPRLAHDHRVAGAHVLRRTWSSLCSVASPTVDPPTNTGSSEAKGVARPVRPIDTMMRSKLVVRSSGGNLKAMAQRGARDVGPQPALEVEVVELDHGAVDLVVEVVAVLLPVSAERLGIGGAVHHLDVGVDGKPAPAQQLEPVAVAGDGGPALHGPELVGPERELAARR